MCICHNKLYSYESMYMLWCTCCGVHDLVYMTWCRVWAYIMSNNYIFENLKSVSLNFKEFIYKFVKISNSFTYKNHIVICWDNNWKQITALYYSIIFLYKKNKVCLYSNSWDKAHYRFKSYTILLINIFNYLLINKKNWT